MSLDKQMVPGVRVKLSGRFLRSTGQLAGGEGQSIWTVQDCPCSLCASGRYVAVDEQNLNMYTVYELQQNPSLKQRHIARGNLVIHGRPSVRNDG